MRSEYLSGIEGESKSMKKRKKKKGQAEEEESAWGGRYRSEIRDALSGRKVLRSEASWQVDILMVELAGVFTLWHFYLEQSTTGQQQQSENLLHAEALMQMVKYAYWSEMHLGCFNAQWILL